MLITQHPLIHGKLCQSKKLAQNSHISTQFLLFFKYSPFLIAASNHAEKYNASVHNTLNRAGHGQLHYRTQ